jgi:hypothetical protein
VRKSPGSGSPSPTLRDRHLRGGTHTGSVDLIAVPRYALHWQWTIVLRLSCGHVVTRLSLGNHLPRTMRCAGGGTDLHDATVASVIFVLPPRCFGATLLGCQQDGVAQRDTINKLEHLVAQDPAGRVSSLNQEMPVENREPGHRPGAYMREPGKWCGRIG